MADQIGQVLVRSQYRAYALLRGLDEDLEPQGLMHPAGAIVDGLPGQAGPEVSSVALPNSELAHYVVQGLITAAKGSRIHHGSVVLQIDPACDHDRRGQNEVEH